MPSVWSLNDLITYCGVVSEWITHTDFCNESLSLMWRMKSWIRSVWQLISFLLELFVRHLFLYIIWILFYLACTVPTAGKRPPFLPRVTFVRYFFIILKGDQFVSPSLSWFHGLLLDKQRDFSLPIIRYTQKPSALSIDCLLLVIVTNNPIHMLNSLYLPAAVMLIVLMCNVIGVSCSGLLRQALIKINEDCVADSLLLV